MEAPREFVAIDGVGIVITLCPDEPVKYEIIASFGGDTSLSGVLSNFSPGRRTMH